MPRQILGIFVYGKCLLQCIRTNFFVKAVSPLRDFPTDNILESSNAEMLFISQDCVASRPNIILSRLITTKRINVRLCDEPIKRWFSNVLNRPGINSVLVHSFFDSESSNYVITTRVNDIYF